MKTYLLVILAFLLGLFQISEAQIYTSTPKNKGIETLRVNAITMTTSGTLIIGTEDSCIYRSTDKGEKWTKIIPGMSKDEDVRTILQLPNGNILAGTHYDGIYISEDDGITWKASNSGITNYNVRSLAYNSKNNFILAGCEDGKINASTDDGASWMQINKDFSNTLGLHHIATNQHSAEVLAANNSGNGSAVFYSPGPSLGWQQIDFGKSYASYRVGFCNNGNAYVLIIDAGTYSLRKSVDSCKTWTEIGTQAANIFTFNNLNHLYLAGSSIFYTVNQTNYTDFMPFTPDNAIIYCMTFGKDGNIYYGTATNGVHMVDLQTTDVEVENSIITNYSIKNYPNPFNPTTKIQYQIPFARYVSLKVYDLLGNEVADLVNGFQNYGKYEIDFNATNLSSGIYYYRIQSGNFVETRKKILMK